MRRVLLVLLLGLSISSAQTTVTLTGPVSARPGAAVTLSLNASGTPDTGAAGFQWTLGIPAGYSFAASAGPQASSVGKTTTCTTDSAECLLVALNPLNATVIPNGVIALYAGKVPATATAGPASFPLSGVVAVSSTGTLVTTTLGTAYSLLVLDRRDLNGDGKVDGTDVGLMIQEVLASRTNPAACVDDINGDGKCDLQDVFAVLLKALGLVP
jgi:hypothetical protein